MHRKLTLPLAIAAGLLGGLLSRYIAPLPVSAQTTPLQELRAQSFVLVDGHNNTIATFRPVLTNSTLSAGPAIVLLDRNNKEIWRAGVSAKVLAQK